MKKTILLIGIILCIAVIGSVLAIGVYDATDIEGSVTTDTYLYLGLNATEGTGVTLEVGKQTIVPISLSVDSNAVDNWGSATLTITPKANNDKSIKKVTIGLYSDDKGMNAIENANTDANGVITLTGITKNRIVYVRLFLAADATQDDVNGTGGTLTCSFKVAA